MENSRILSVAVTGIPGAAAAMAAQADTIAGYRGDDRQNNARKISKDKKK